MGTKLSDLTAREKKEFLAETKKKMEESLKKKGYPRIEKCIRFKK